MGRSCRWVTTYPCRRDICGAEYTSGPGPTTGSLCDVCAVAEEEVRSAACGLPGQPRVINLEPQTITEVIESVRQVGDAVGCRAKADSVAKALQARIEIVAQRSARLTQRPRVVLLEWIDPPFSCGHWSPQLVRLAGGEEQLGIEGRPSRTLKWSEVVASQPEVLFIACCGFDISRTLDDLPILVSKPDWNNLPCVQSGRVYVVNGSHYFSRPGPRLVDSLEMLAHALHPDVHPLPSGLPEPVQIDLAAIKA